MDQSASTYQAPAHGLEYLGRSRRFGALLIEILIWAIAFAVADRVVGEVLSPVVVLPAHIVYRGAMVNKYGGTVGHLAVGGRIVDYSTGNPVTVGQSFSRALVGLFDFLFVPVLANGLMVLIRPDRRHIYDLVADTVAIRKQETETEDGEVTRESEASPTTHGRQLG